MLLDAGLPGSSVPNQPKQKITYEYDFGGIGGFYELLETIKDPDDSEYESTMEWFHSCPIEE